MLQKVLYPMMVGYNIKLQDTKFIGGTMQFIETGKEFEARYIDTRNMDISIWISDMRAVVSPSIIYFYATFFDRGSRTDYTVPLVRLTTTKDVNGITLPKKVFDMGIERYIYEIGIRVVNFDNPDNHEFFFWDGANPSNQYIVLQTS